jgi:poly-gamma-glutamate synthesis protein (capsule biosynthesis protein)
VVGAHVVNAAARPVPVVSRQVSAGPDGQVSLRIVGDTMLGGEYPRLAAEHGQDYDWAFDALRPSLTDADFVLAVAGAPFTDITVPWDAAQAISFRTSPPEAASALGRAGVDALMLATDHAFDTGPDGLADTIAHADAAGIVAIGAGPDLAQAEQPLLLRTELGTVAVVGFGESFGFRARHDAPGTMVLSQQAIQRGADLARAAGADWVIAATYWGDGYGPVAPRQRYWAQVFAAAGYDLVVGSGPHIAQPIEFVDGMPVIYSVGNFVYGTTGRLGKLGIPGYGLSVEVQLRRDQGPQLGVRCILADNRQVNFQARPCAPGEAQAFLPTLSPQLDMQGDVGVVRCTCFGRQEAQ